MTESERDRFIQMLKSSRSRGSHKRVVSGWPFIQIANLPTRMASPERVAAYWRMMSDQSGNAAGVSLYRQPSTNEKVSDSGQKA